jgi:hypothetical protein
MPLSRLLQDFAFEPEMIDAMAAAFEEACHMLGLAQVEDPLRELVASKIIECAQTGVREQALLRDCALQAIQK